MRGPHTCRASLSRWQLRAGGSEPKRMHLFRPRTFSFLGVSAYVCPPLSLFLSLVFASVERNQSPVVLVRGGAVGVDNYF